MIVTRTLSGNSSWMEKFQRVSKHIIVKKFKRLSPNSYEITFDSPDDMNLSSKRSIKGFLSVDKSYAK